MIKEINVQELKTLNHPILIDVRSEKEFAEATLPGAINLPLFNNEERVQVGKTYTLATPRMARELGLKIVSKKLPNLVKKVGGILEKWPFSIILLERWNAK